MRYFKKQRNDRFIAVMGNKPPTDKWIEITLEEYLIINPPKPPVEEEVEEADVLSK